MKKYILYAILLLTNCKTDNTQINPTQSEKKEIHDGKYCADIEYFNKNTNTESAYRLIIYVDNNYLKLIKFPQGWLDEDEFGEIEIDETGFADFETKPGHYYTVQINDRNVKDCFDNLRKPKQCLGVTKNGKRCLKLTDNQNGLCWNHSNPSPSEINHTNVISNIKIQNQDRFESNIQNDYLSKWLYETIGIDYTIGLEILRAAHFNSNKYKDNPTRELIDQIEIKDIIYTDLTYSNKLIKISFTGEESNGLIFVDEKRFIYTFHLTFGTYAKSVVYDLESRKVKTFPFQIYNIKNNYAEIEREEYGFENGIPTGRNIKKGRLNLETGKVVMEK